MAQPFVGSGNRIRLSPLEQAVAASKAPSGSGGGKPGAGVASSGVASALGTSAEPGLDANNPAHVQAAVEAAQQGDQGAIDWLKTIGLGGGVLAGTAAAGAAYSRHVGRNTFNDQPTARSIKQPAVKMGATNIAQDASIARHTMAVPGIIPERVPNPSLDLHTMSPPSTQEAVKALMMGLRGIR